MWSVGVGIVRAIREINGGFNARVLFSDLYSAKSLLMVGGSFVSSLEHDDSARVSDFDELLGRHLSGGGGDGGA